MPEVYRRQYIRGMSGDSGRTWPQADEVRWLVPLLALAIACVAVAFDRGSVTDAALAAVAVTPFTLWAFVPATPLAAVSVAVLVPVVAAQRGGALEPLFFEVSLLAFVVGRWTSSLRQAAGLAVLCALSPVAVALIQDPSEISVGIWIVGIVFPWVLARAVARQSQLAVQLETTRRELAEQALLAERRRIARDVHDLVGHGLAAVMLQVTSARHVLRRDPGAAEEALRTAEEAGRRSMHELRGTVALLRSDDETAIAAPLPSASDIRTLVEDARDGGLSVQLHVRGDPSLIPAGVGVALYRIAQEALANAARHAPQARTMLGLELANGEVRLVADTSGPRSSPASAEPERQRYGLVGMRERATALGGELEAGPTSEGWRISARIPIAEEPV
jgi:signal transduction histidine kinase